MNKNIEGIFVARDELRAVFMAERPGKWILDDMEAVARHVLADDASVARYRRLLGIETARTLTDRIETYGVQALGAATGETVGG